MNRSMWAAAGAAALLTACSSTLQTTPATGPTSAPGTTPVTFVVVVPGGGNSSSVTSRARRPRFISPSTQSIVVALAGTTLLTMNVSASSHACKPGANGSRTCTARASAPSGKRVFAIGAFDGAAGTGNVLASGTLSATLVANRPQQLHIALTGTPASIALSVKTPYPPAGSAATAGVTVAALDADGNTIVGSYGTKIRLADSDTTGATTLSVTSVSTSSTKVTLAYDGAPLSQALLSAKASRLARATAVFAPSPTSVAQYTAPPVQTKSAPLPAGLWDLCMGPDGNIWATANSSGAIEKITPDGTFTAYLVLRSAPMGISVGSDRNLWFAEQQAGKIGKITLGGNITNYTIPVPPGGISRPGWTTLGPDGRTWFVDSGIDAVAAGAITSAGKITKYPLPQNSSPVEITAGPDGNLWITDGGLNAIVVLSTSGKVVAVHQLPTANASPYGIAVGSDKNIWFTEFQADLIGRMTTSGALKEFAVPSAVAGPLGITAGPDGNVWFTESGGGFWDSAGKIGYVTTDGSRIRDFPAIGTIGNFNHVHNLAFDSTGVLWYTEQSGLFSALAKFIY